MARQCDYMLADHFAFVCCGNCIIGGMLAYGVNCHYTILQTHGVDAFYMVYGFMPARMGRAAESPWCVALMMFITGNF